VYISRVEIATMTQKLGFYNCCIRKMGKKTHLYIAAGESKKSPTKKNPDISSGLNKISTCIKHSNHVTSETWIHFFQLCKLFSNGSVLEVPWRNGFRQVERVIGIFSKN